MPGSSFNRVALVLVTIIALAGRCLAPVAAQTIDPCYSGSYALADLGSVPGVPPLYGGLVFYKDDPNVPLIGGNANGASGALWSVGVVRDGSNHVIVFSAPATRCADAAYNDGGVVYGPDGVLFLARWPVNELGQTVPGSNVADKISDTAALGVAG